MSTAFITKLDERIDALKTEKDGILDAAAEGDGRELTSDEETRLAAIKVELDAKTAKRAELIEDEQRAIEADKARARFEPVVGRTRIEAGRQEQVYREDGGPSYFRDLYSASRGDMDSRERLERSRKLTEEVRVEYRRLELRDGTTGATSFGSFIPPVWLLDRLARKARAGRPVANLIENVGPPTSTSITIPRITTGSSTAIQTADNAAVSETDIITAQLTRTTATIAGMQDVSLQGVELSPMAVDQLIFSDLLADYNAQLDNQVLNGSGASGQLLGILNISGTNAVTYTDASPTVGELYPKLADGIQQIATARFEAAEVIIVHPRRWGWITAAVDTAGRPLVVPSAGFNAVARMGEVAAQGVVGELQGLPVVADAQIPLTLGGGTEDEVVIFRPSDCVLMEGSIRTDVFPDIGSGTLTLRFRLYAFVNFFAGRFPASISEINGTGVIAPTF